MYVFHFPMSMEEFRSKLSVYAKKLSLNALTTRNVYIYRLRKHSMVLIYISEWSLIAFHAIIRKRDDGLKVIGIFGISPVLYGVLFVLFPLLETLVFTKKPQGLVSAGYLFDFGIPILLYIVYEIVINLIPFQLKERVVSFFQKLTTSEPEKNENQSGAPPTV